MTLIELLLVGLLTAIIATAAATLLGGASNASAQSGNARTVYAAGHYAEGRMGAVIRQARAIGQVTASALSLWIADTNDDDMIQLSEAGVIYYDATHTGINLLQTDPSAAAATITPVTQTTFQDANQLSIAIQAMGSKTANWADKVQACTFDGYPSLTDTRVISATFTIGTGSDATDFAVTASPKAPADYLFQSNARTAPSGSETRYSRSKVSPYSGVSTAQ